MAAIAVPDAVAALRSRKWAETLRPLDAFIDPSRFRRPRTLAEASGRVELNLDFFLTNYVLLSLVVLTAVVLTQPTLLLVFSVAGALAEFSRRSPEVRLGSVVLKGRDKAAATGALVTVLVLYFAGTVIFLVLGVTVVAACLHAALHVPEGEPGTADPAAAPAGEPDVEMAAA